MPRVPEGWWSLYWTQCRDCGTTAVRHHSHGRCLDCRRGHDRVPGSVRGKFPRQLKALLPVPKFRKDEVWRKVVAAARV